MFDVSADAYTRFMGRFSAPLAGAFADLVGVEPPSRALDVGCGAGALTRILADRLGVDHVAAVDPSAPFVDAMRARYPGMDVRLASAESLPFADASFDFALAQLVVHFMSDPVAGLSEMARVCGPGGVVAASVWNHAEGGNGPLSSFLAAARSLSPDAPDESLLPGVNEGHLAELFEAAGLTDVTSTSIDIRVEHPTFDDWWEPFTLGVGPAGVYVARLDEAQREALRERCLEMQPPAPFATEATAWVAIARC